MIDPDDALASVIERLDAARSDAIPKGPLPPRNVDALDVARAEARAAAEDAGRGEDLDQAQRLMADWMFERYRTTASNPPSCSAATMPSSGAWT